MSIIRKKREFTYPSLRRRDNSDKTGLAGDDVLCSTGGTSLASNVFMVITALIMVYSLFRINGSVTGKNNWAFDITIVFICWLLAYVSCTYMHYKTFYLYTSAYVVALVMFHLSITIQQGLGADIPSNWGIIKYKNFSKWLEFSGWYTILALSSLGIGISLSPLLSKNKRISYAIATAKKKLSYAAGNWSAIGLLIAAGIFFVMAIASYGNLLEYSRADIYQSHADSRGFGVFTMIFPGAVGLFLLSSDSKKQYKIGAVLCVFAFLLFMLSGYRSGALFSSLIGVISWVKTGRKFPAWLAISSIVFVLFAISFVGVLRTLGSYGELGDKQIQESLEKTNLAGSVSTMGQTGGLLAHVIRLVPETDPYRYGGSYLFALKDSIPNIGFKIDNEYSRDEMLSRSFSHPEVIAQMPPSDWMTYRILKEQFRLGQGVGFSTIGEAYLNFGTFGVVIFFILLGGGVGLLDHKKIIYNPYLFIFCCAMLWPLVRTVRNDFANFIKPGMFMLIILVIFWAFSRAFLNKRIKS